ncbi:MAG: MFS transporter [Betaproteobacteria bacterium]
MSAKSPAQEPAPAVPFARRIPLIVAAAFFMEMLDGTIVTTSLPAIAASFGESALELTSIITVYLVAMGAFIPTAGWASARFGARNLFAAAIAVFTLASLVCGAAPSFTVLLIARLVQGIAAAFMSPVGRLVVLRQTPKDQIIRAIGLIVWPGLIAPVLGPALGGFITTYTSWRWIFFINIPVGLVGVWLVLHFIPADAKEAPTRLDKTGFVLTAIGLAALVHGLALAGDPGSRVAVYATWIAVGLVFSVVAIRHALRHPTPMLDLRAVRAQTFQMSVVTAGMLSRTAISMTPFLIPLMFQVGLGANAITGGVMLLVYMAGNLVMKSFTTPILHRFRFYDVLWVNGALCVLALVGCAMLGGSTPLAITYAVLFVAGMTRSMHFTSTSTLAFADVSDAHRAGATTLWAMAQQFGNVLGVAIAAFVAGISQTLRGGAPLSLADFHWALYASAGMMAVAVLWLLKLPRDAGAELARKPSGTR